jgi:death-on-curing family protein
LPFLFLRKQDVIDIHAQLIEAFGGIHGLRDEGALKSALAAAENRCNCENADLSACAATYAYHLSQAHAFMDGNKRIAAAASEIFLKLNARNSPQPTRRLCPSFWTWQPVGYRAMRSTHFLEIAPSRNDAR